MIQSRLFPAVILLCILSILLLCLWYYIVHKRTKRLYNQIKTEKEETELKLKIKEEQVSRIQSEIDEILSEYRIRAGELEAENTAVAQLKKEKAASDEQMEAYLQKITEYELNNEQQQKLSNEENMLNQLFLEDIVKLINKKLSKKNEYIELLKQIDGQYISTLKASHNGNLSVRYLKYCICFAIGMEIGEVSECFSIEPASVHVARYRLKKNLGLSNHDDLDIHLRLLILNH